jgi:hypothetical protein
MKTLLAIAVVVLMTAGAALATTSVCRTFYVGPGDQADVDDLNLSCLEGNWTGFPVNSLAHVFASGNASSGNGPYVRFYPTRIVVVYDGATRAAGCQANCISRVARGPGTRRPS